MSGAKKEPMKVAEALARYLSRSGLGDRLEQTSNLGDWAERVGPRIAEVAEPLHVTNDVLIVAVKSSAWLMELRMMESEIRGRLNDGREKGRIRGIRFVQEGDTDHDGAPGEGSGDGPGQGPGRPRQRRPPKWGRRSG